MRTIPLEVKFWRKVQISEACWKWNACTHRFGYGIIRHNGGNVLAHRASWIIHKGEIPKGMHVLHRCDNPQCANPDHLFLGTQGDNIRDMVRKRRNFSPFSANKKLTDDAIRAIRGAFVRGLRGSAKTLAAKYGVSEFTIYHIASGNFGRMAL